jgi:hypothetical protein
MFQLKKRVLMVCLLIFSIVPNSFSQIQKSDEFYFNPVYAGNDVLITTAQSSSGYIDSALTKAIESVNKKGGGIITIKTGDYKVKETAFLLSNVHIQFEPNVHFYMDDAGLIFHATSAVAGKPIENFSLVGLGQNKSERKGKDERFTVHFTYGNAKNKKKNKKNAFLKLGYTTNFKVANINIIDSFTDLSSILLSGEVDFIDIVAEQKLLANQSKSKKAKKRKSEKVKYGRTNLIREVYGVPSKGIIENSHNENGSYGYGLIQMQAGNNIVYRDLTGSGGATLRLESGLNVNQLFRPVGSAPIYTFDGVGLPLTIDNQPKIDNVYGHNIHCVNGHAAFTMSPHTVKQGKVFLSKIRSKSCEAGGEVSKGFINNFKREEKAGIPVSTFGIEKGSYSNKSTITDLVAEFGQNSQIKSKNFRYIPCALRIDRGVKEPNVGLSTELSLDFESRRGPSLFPLHYGAFERAKGDGGYHVNIDKKSIKSIGFGDKVEDISIENPFAVCENVSDFSTEIRAGKSKNKGKKAKKKTSHQ